MGAIDDADEAAVREFADARNMIAHELRHFVGGGKTPDFSELFPRLVELVTKIDRWWIVNVEIPIDPDLEGREIDEDGITPGSLWTMQMLWRVALGDEDEAWELYRAFVEGSEPSQAG